MTPLLYRYTDAEIKLLLKTLTVLIDSREKENQHITGYLSAKGIPHIVTGLEYGDYSYMLPSCPELGIQRDIYFTSSLVIERKNSLEELSGNLSKYRERFENEFLRAGQCKKILMIERGCYSDIYNSKYNTQLKNSAFIASLLAFQHRFNIFVSFIDLGNAGTFIYQNCYYHAREYLKGD